MKKKIIYSLFFILVVLVTSCELPDNIDPKNAKIVSPDVLFTQVEIALVKQITDMDWNCNISRLLVQYQSEVLYTEESRYDFSFRHIPDAFSENIYEGVLMNLKDMTVLIKSSSVPTDAAIGQKKNRLAIAEIWAVYAYQVLVDQFGNIPYSEALKGADNSRPKYDDALTIYQDLITRLNAAIADLDENYEGFGSADILYNGDIVLWKKFAASLKLRIGLRLSDVPAANSGTLVAQALGTGVFTDELQSAILTYYGITPYVSPYYQVFVNLGRNDFSPSNTLVDIMNTLNDPRRAVWFTEYPEDSGSYLGLPYGEKGANSYYKFSHFADEIRINPRLPTILCDYVEVEFLLAEAAEKGLGGVTDAETHYNNAILASMNYWGVSNTDAVAYMAQSTVAYTSAAGSYKQKIGIQKWLGLFDRGVEAWAEWRRLDYPVLNVPEDMTYEEIPVRMPYPYYEITMNKENYEAAAAAIGGDKATIKLFWDKF
jgi:hypothetical protein